jgi:hypothetical protein
MGPLARLYPDRSPKLAQRDSMPIDRFEAIGIDHDTAFALRT